MTESLVSVLAQDRRIRLRCMDPSCWVDTIEVTSKGGRLMHGPVCPHCQVKLSPDDTWPGAEPEFGAALEAITSEPKIHIHLHSSGVNLRGESDVAAILNAILDALKHRDSRIA